MESNIEEGNGGIRKSAEVCLQAPFGTEIIIGLQTNDETRALGV
jgi:hypothetical protein